MRVFFVCMLAYGFIAFGALSGVKNALQRLISRLGWAE